jgi:hypothetical protein
MKLAVGVLLLGACAAQAQWLKIPASIEKLADKADEVVDVTLDQNMLNMASRFLSDKNQDEASAKKVIAGLKGIYVRSYTFSQEGVYSQADVEALRSQLRGPEWSCIVKVRSMKNHDNADVCLITKDGKIAGLAVIATEPKELTIVSINGTIDPDQIHLLEGQFGIPKMDLDTKSKKQDKTEK